MDIQKKQKLSNGKNPFKNFVKKEEEKDQSGKVNFNSDGTGIKTEDPVRVPLPKHIGLDFEASEDENPISKLNLNFLQQKFPFYRSRCEALRNNLMRQTTEAWGDFILGPPVVELNEGIRAHLIGNIRAELTYKPNIIVETKTNFDISKPPRVEKYFGDSDKYYISDPFGSILLTGELLKEFVFFTGVVVGVRGTIKSGALEVDSVVLPKINPYKPLTVKPDVSSKYIAFVSGLKFNEPNPKVDVLKEFLMSNLARSKVDGINIVKLIVAGGSLDYKMSDADKEGDNWNKYRKKIRKVDSFLSELGFCTKVAILPGDLDPADLVPSKQFHPIMFRKARQVKGVTLPCSPYASSVENLTMVGDTGSIVNDMCKYGEIGPIDALKWMVRYNLLAPNLYDTVSCQPMEEDPYIMQQLPHLIFTANCSKFETELADINGQKVRLLAIPKYHEQPKLVLVDVHTLECETITF